MKVRELMTREVECTRPDASLAQAAEKMKLLDVGSLPVCHEDQLVGMITDRDIVVRSVSDGHDPETDHVEDVMTRDLFFCFDDQAVEAAVKLMRDHQVRRLPVLNRRKQLVGIVSLADITLETEELVEEALDGISEPG